MSCVQQNCLLYSKVCAAFILKKFAGVILNVAVRSSFCITFHVAVFCSVYLKSLLAMVCYCLCCTTLWQAAVLFHGRHCVS